MNVLTVKKILFICEISIYIYRMGRQKRLKRPGRCQRFECFHRFARPGTFTQIAKPKFWQTSRGSFFLLNSGRNFFPFISFFKFLFIFEASILTVVNERHKNRFLLLELLPNKRFLFVMG